MANTILLKSSSVAAKIPTTSSLSLRELAINTNDGKLYLRQGSGVAGDNIYTVNPWIQSTGGSSYDLSFTSGNVGIGASPVDALTVLGKIHLQQNSSSTNRFILRGQPSSSYRWNIDNNGASNNFRIFREDDDTAANGAVYLNINNTGLVSVSSFQSTGVLYDSSGAAGTNGQVLTSTGTGTSWSSAGSGSITVSDDTTTNATRYLTFTSSTSGSLTTENVSSTKLTFNPSTGTLSATIFSSLSDASLKENIQQIKNATDVIKNLRGVRYDWINGEKNQIGVIAQEIEKVIPEVVKEADGVKSVAYSNIVALLIEAIKEQQIQIENLEKKINA